MSCRVGCDGLLFEKVDRQAVDGRFRKNSVQRKLYVELVSYLRHDLGSKQRVASEIEEILLNAYSLTAQHATPDPLQHAFGIGTRGHEGGWCIGPREIEGRECSTIHLSV